MTKRERIMAILNKQPTDRCGYWTGHPHAETQVILSDYFNVEKDPLALALALKDDMIFFAADDITWNHPDGKPIFDCYGGHAKESLGQEGIFCNCTSVDEVNAYDWPNPDNLDFTAYEQLIDTAIENDLAVFGGFWSPFFHKVADFFGMENYFIKMYTDPDVVLAVTNHVVDFYVEANKRCFEALGDKLDVFFFGNDFGSQRDLLISPEAFTQFVLPSYKRLIDTAKLYDKKVMLHSCGAINKAIPMLIDAGIDALHPLQAMADNMDPVTLSQYKDKIAFCGGVDTQELLPAGSTKEIEEAVDYLKRILGPSIIISPSHEALLPDVPIPNVVAMRDRAMIS